MNNRRNAPHHLIRVNHWNIWYVANWFVHVQLYRKTMVRERLRVFVILFEWFRILYNISKSKFFQSFITCNSTTNISQTNAVNFIEFFFIPIDLDLFLSFSEHHPEMNQPLVQNNVSQHRNHPAMYAIHLYYNPNRKHLILNLHIHPLTTNEIGSRMFNNNINNHWRHVQHDLPWVVQAQSLKVVPYLHQHD